ncbi:MAG: gamma-glutamylcyclotransferase [Cyanobacteriota bacterium]
MEKTEREKINKVKSTTNVEYKIFVYGTLKPGEDNYNYHCHNRYELQFECSVKGDIYDLSLGFPALVESDNVAKGVLFYFNDQQTIDQIDILEGYDPGISAEKNLYYKKLVEVYDSNDQVIDQAYAYFMPLNRVKELKGVKVDSGCWTGKNSFKTDEHKKLVNKIRSKC